MSAQRTPPLEEGLPGVRQNVAMRDYTTWRAGGVADYFFEAKSIEELVSAVLEAHKRKIPYLVLGNGSNVLFSDQGFGGLVIRNRSAAIAFTDRGQVLVDAGVLLVQLILAAAQRNLSGLEWLFSVPGSVGGAVYGNAGTHGVSIGSFVRSVTLLYPEGKIVRVGPKWFAFGYRTSRLKQWSSTKPKPIILSIRLQLAHSKQEDIQARIQQVKAWRIENQPLGEHTAGSVFRNPGQGHHFPSKLPSEHSAWAVIRESGAHRLRVGDAAVSAKHANFITNRGKATAQQIKTLISMVKKRVLERTGIELKEEVEYVGAWD